MSWKLHYLRDFLLKFSKKVVPDQLFFSEFLQVQTIFCAFFAKKKISHVFFQKYTTIGSTNFENVHSKKLVSFLTPFFAVCGSLLADIIRVFWPKKSKDIWSDILFFFVISFFFLPKKVSEAEIGQKKKKISLLKSRISLSILTSGPKLGIKRCYQ